MDRGSYQATDFDREYAVARLTPGTNLLALYTQLGHRLGGWRMALAALAVGAAAPAALSIGLAVLYTRQADNFTVARMMQGARAGALAVFLWAVVRLLRPQLASHRARGLGLAIAALAAAVLVPAQQVMVLVAAGLLGAVALRPPA